MNQLNSCDKNRDIELKHIRVFNDTLRCDHKKLFYKSKRKPMLCSFLNYLASSQIFLVPVVVLNSLSDNFSNTIIILLFRRREHDGPHEQHLYRRSDAGRCR